MRVVTIVAGAGGMYCGACLHAATLAAALRKAGQDALLVPAYTPVRMEEEPEGLATRRVALGGLNVFLQQESALARRLPRWLDRLLDHPALLRWLGGRAGSTHPARLGPLCVSMLRGEEGRQRKEVAKLLEWLDRDLRPDVVHLSTALLAGMARPIAQRLKVPVVGTLSGEDSFLEKLVEPYRGEAIRTLRARCADLAALVALNRYYAGFMAEYLAVPRERIHVVAPGLDLTGHRQPSEASPDAPPPGSGEFRIGFLSRICPDKGLHLLADAFALLAADREVPPTRLLAAGHLAAGDRRYLAEVQADLARRGLAARFEHVGCLQRADKIAFLQSLDVLSTPTALPESKGLPVLEAWASGVPAVVPAHGAFPEMVEHTGGGLLCAPGDVSSLAAALRRLILDPHHAAELGRRAQAAVHRHYHAGRMARDMIDLYRRVLGSR